MVVVIVLGVVDVAWQLHQKAMAPPLFILKISDMLDMFGAFMAVLIAIEIFVNITIYLRDDVIHVKIVMATALMAIAKSHHSGCGYNRTPVSVGPRVHRIRDEYRLLADSR